jgi:hypothetical protein
MLYACGQLTSVEPQAALQLGRFHLEEIERTSSP